MEKFLTLVPPRCAIVQYLLATRRLTRRCLKIVNGPEVLNKYVGASEEKVRDLFVEAEHEQEEMGDESGLHIIIFDELDAICKQRGSVRDGTGVSDSVVHHVRRERLGCESGAAGWGARCGCWRSCVWCSCWRSCMAWIR